MKIIKGVIIVATLVIVAVVLSKKCGLMGWMTAEECDWQFIQDTGGICFGTPLEIDGMQMLPISYDASGQIEITRPPRIVGTGKIVRRVEIKKVDAQLVIRVVAQDGEVGASVHYVNLQSITPGSYEVFYGTPGDQEKMLGRIVTR